MMKFLFILFFALTITGCVESGDNSMVQLDGPILESVDKNGDIEYDGAVTNIGDNPVESVYIVIILKDSDGNVLVADSKPLYDVDEDRLLYPQQREFFSITMDADPNKVYSKDVEIYYDEVPPDNSNSN